MNDLYTIAEPLPFADAAFDAERRVDSGQACPPPHRGSIGVLASSLLFAACGGSVTDLDVLGPFSVTVTATEDGYTRSGTDAALAVTLEYTEELSPGDCDFSFRWGAGDEVLGTGPTSEGWSASSDPLWVRTPDNTECDGAIEFNVFSGDPQPSATVVFFEGSVLRYEFEVPTLKLVTDDEFAAFEGDAPIALHADALTEITRASNASFTSDGYYGTDASTPDYFSRELVVSTDGPVVSMAFPGDWATTVGTRCESPCTGDVDLYLEGVLDSDACHGFQSCAATGGYSLTFPATFTP